MRKIVLTLVPLLGVALAKVKASDICYEKITTQTSRIQYEQTVLLASQLGPGKNYRAQLARSYFGSNSKCRNWKRFCGR